MQHAFISLSVSAFLCRDYLIRMDLTNPKMRPKIIRTLKLRSKYEKAAQEVLNQIDSDLKDNVEQAVMDEAAKYELIDETLLRRVNMMICKQEYYKIKPLYETAVNDVINQGKPIKETAEHYGINDTELHNEVIRGRYDKEHYKYDKKPENSIEVFSYCEEELLLEDLEKWIGKNNPGCICQVCVFELLSKLAYEFAQRKYISCPDYWNIHHHTDIDWLQEFEIRHCSELYNMYSMEFCLRQPTISKCILMSPY